jgi:hypothetical protein
MTDDELKERAAVLAMIAKLPKDATIADFNELRFRVFIIPEDQERMH